MLTPAALASGLLPAMAHPMAKSNPTRPNPPADEVRIRDNIDLPETEGSPLRDPRSVAAMDDIGVDDQGDLLDVELDDQPGDRGEGKRTFSDDVRSDTNDDEAHERR
jgi:hypothetical protein